MSAQTPASPYLVCSSSVSRSSMDPKQKAVDELGSVARNGECGWRAKGLDVGGPTRSTEADAWRDLSYGRSGASREEFKNRLQALRQDNFQQSASPVPSDSAAPRLCHDAVGITAVSFISHACASPRKRLRTKSPATAAPSLCHTAAGSLSSEELVASAAPGLHLHLNLHSDAPPKLTSITIMQR